MALADRAGVQLSGAGVNTLPPTSGHFHLHSREFGLYALPVSGQIIGDFNCSICKGVVITGRIVRDAVDRVRLALTNLYLHLRSLPPWQPSR